MKKIDIYFYKQFSAILLTYNHLHILQLTTLRSNVADLTLSEQLRELSK